MQGGAALGLLAETVGRSVSAGRHAGGATAELADALDAAVDRVLEVTGALWATGDVELALANSTVYLEALGHVVVAWLWLEQLLAAADREGDFYEGKRAAAAYFQRYELPKVGPQLDLLASLDRLTLDLDERCF